MRIRSFRIRLALITASVSGIILALFGTVAWLLLYRELEKTVDARITVPAEKMLYRMRPSMDWRRFQRALEFFFSEEWNHERIMVVKDWDGKTLYEPETGSWPESIPIGQYLRNRPEFSPEIRDEEIRGASSRRRYREGERGRRRPPGRPEGRPFPSRPGPGRGPFGGRVSYKAEYFTARADGIDWRVGVFQTRDLALFMGVNFDEFNADVRRMRNYFLLALPISLGLIVVGGWIVSRKAMRPIARVTETAARVTASGLDERIPYTGREDKEFSRLIEVLNSMMTRLEASFNQAVRFSADASHELKTPLTIMQGELEAALQQTEPGSREETTLVSLSEEVHRLKTITSSLLLLSRVDAGRLKLTIEPTNLSDELNTLCEDAEAVGEKEQLAFTRKIEPGVVTGVDRTLIRQAIQNLLGNAIKYNHTNGSVVCELVTERKQGKIRIDVRNTGPGIPESDGAKVLDRFYRVDKARGRGVDGFGLGLNLALEIVRAHGGALVLQQSSPEWTAFRVTLPLTTTPESSEHHNTP